MLRYIAILAGVILTSFYYFPFRFTFLPGINTKMLMAIVALPIVIINAAKSRNGIVNRNFLTLVIFASFVSLASYASVTYNTTSDFTYVSYIFSMLVWLAGAYTLIQYLSIVHENVTVSVIARYLAAASAMQCLLAIGIDSSPAVFNTVHSFLYGMSGLDEFAKGRLYGVGCAFDVAGIRFSAVLIIMAASASRIAEEYEHRPAGMVLYLMAFAIISIIGNMISRTTTVGMVMAMIYMVYSLRLYNLRHLPSTTSGFLRTGIVIMLVFAVFAGVLYETDMVFRRNFRFAFEGFFSLVEEGRWEVHSNELLWTMYRFPETIKTWLIGDGYFYNTFADPYYVGEEYGGYYMATDVGYLRFIYYAGLPCLLLFIIFIWKSSAIGMQFFPGSRLMFVFLFVLQLLVWLKVSSDIFSAFAIFLALGMARKEPDAEEEIIAAEI